LARSVAQRLPARARADLDDFKIRHVALLLPCLPISWRKRRPVLANGAYPPSRVLSGR
jgi:hypothetical protein